MNERTVDHESETPVYMQIAAYVIADIERGEIPVGRRIPSESALVQRYGVARETARAAVRHMREQGYVRTVPQRGSFVVDRSKPAAGE
ncbi:GntR family transcriptional regulator [Streptomyces sp. NPDC057386]|uniref:GntR family transcriptional regulator n=1 Tax=unclassified Streptomyces TaxID=2593676 RepID=UPI00363B6A49